VSKSRADEHSKKRSTKQQEQSPVSAAWKVQKRAALLSRRYDFSDYDEMRNFLDRLETLSEKEKYYPDLTFSRTHVNVSIKSRDEELAQPDFEFSVLVDAISDTTSNDTD